MLLMVLGQGVNTGNKYPNLLPPLLSLGPRDRETEDGETKDREEEGRKNIAFAREEETETPKADCTEPCQAF